MKRNIILAMLALAAITIFAPAAIASDTKTAKKLLNEWSKFAAKINSNQASAIFVTRVTSCSFCSLAGFNILMSELTKELPHVNRISVIANADEKELVAYNDIFPKSLAIVRATERDIDKAFSLTVYPTFYLVSPDGSILFEQQDITHNLPPIDTLKHYAEKVKTIQKSPSAHKVLHPKIVSVKNIEEMHPLIQMTSVSTAKKSDNSAYILDGIQNSVLKINLNKRTISRHYKLENTLEYWFDSDRQKRYTWPDGTLDTTNYFELYQQTSPLTQIKSIHTVNGALNMFCRLHTGYKREFIENKKRIMFLVDFGLVSLSENAAPQSVALFRNEYYKIYPPIIELSNGQLIGRVLANTESGKAKLPQDSNAVFATYTLKDSSLKVSTNSKILFSNDIYEEDFNLYSDESQGFICINRRLRWFFHATPLHSGDYNYKAITPYGIWKQKEDKIISLDGYIHNNIFHVILLLNNGELWVQKYSLANDEVHEHKFSAFQSSKYTQLKIIQHQGDSLALLAKHQKKRWQLVRISL